MHKSHLILVGAPRSGTTVFWKALRADERFTCYMEPFHPQLRKVFELGADLFDSYAREYEPIEDLLRAHWSSVRPYEEILETVAGHRADYLRALLDTDSHVCIKTVRCCGKIERLREIAPDALVVHLARDPRCWVTSHLRPNGEWPEGLPERFFTYRGSFDRWGREELARELDADGFAHEQLLQVWNVLAGLAEAGSPHVSMSFDRFARSPDEVMDGLYGELDLTAPDVDLGFVRDPTPPHRPGDDRWETALTRWVHPYLTDFEASF